MVKKIKMTKRQYRKLSKSWLGIIVILGILGFNFYQEYKPVSGSERFEVTLDQCVDGDTAWFDIDGKRTKVRFLYIDTPESTNQIEPYGKEASDYTKEQLDVWATGQVDLEKWNQSFQEHYSIIAVEDEVIVGFGDIDKTGYLDRLFVHADYQKKGIATAICNRLEQAVQGDITTHASITAKPFFEKRGYKVVKEQQVERQGIFLTNFCMEKNR